MQSPEDYIYIIVVQRLAIKSFLILLMDFYLFPYSVQARRYECRRGRGGAGWEMLWVGVGESGRRGGNPRYNGVAHDNVNVWHGYWLMSV